MKLFHRQAQGHFFHNGKTQVSGITIMYIAHNASLNNLWKSCLQYKVHRPTHTSTFCIISGHGVHDKCVCELMHMRMRNGTSVVQLHQL